LNDYERVVENLFKSLEETYEHIRGDVKIFFRQSDEGINRYFTSYTDKYLLTLDKGFIDELRKYIAENKTAREERIINLLGRLNDVEYERETTINDILARIRGALVDNAFILEPEVNKFIEVK